MGGDKTRTIIGQEIPNIPWEERPSGCTDVVWRSKRNPIIPRNLIPSSNSIFNSAVVPFQDGFAGVFRCDDRRRMMQLHAGRSVDGSTGKLTTNGYVLYQDDPRSAALSMDKIPVCWIEDRYYVAWCNGYHGQPLA